MRRRLLRSLGFLCLGAVLLSSACREIPPRIPPGYRDGSGPPGWPPLAVYDPEPLHPANRWFHRAFGGRTAAGDIVPPHADEPSARLAEPSRVDAAEIGALLDTARADRPLADALFRSDALHEAARISAALPPAPEHARELVPLLLAAARDDDPSRDPDEGLTRTLSSPPPLREEGWVEMPAPPLPGLLPSPGDPRWTRRFRKTEGDRSRSLLVRLRILLAPDGSPRPWSLGSECWELDRSAGRMLPRAWRFDRAEWLQGRDPWREIPEEERLSIRDPSGGGAALEGRLGSLCSRCHEPGRPPAPDPGRETPPSQADLVRGAVAGLLAGDAEGLPAIPGAGSSPGSGGGPRR